MTVAYSATFARRTTQRSLLSFESKWNTETTRISIWIENKIYYPKAVFYLNTCRLVNPLNRASAFENPNWIQIENSNWKKSPNVSSKCKKRGELTAFMLFMYLLVFDRWVNGILAMFSGFDRLHTVDIETEFNIQSIQCEMWAVKMSKLAGSNHEAKIFKLVADDFVNRGKVFKYLSLYRYVCGFQDRA